MTTDFDFDAKIQELQKIVNQLEKAQSLENALSCYAEGVVLIKELNQYLADAEKRMTIEVLK